MPHRALRPALAILLCSGSTACGVTSRPIECIDDTNCNLAAGGACLVNPATSNQFCTYPDGTCPTGQRWSDYDVELGISGECVGAVEIDAGVDAPVTCPITAPVQNGQAADLVLGQPTVTGGTANNPFESGQSMQMPRGVFSDGSRLWVTDSGNARVLQWNSLPIVVGQTADVAVGQAALTSHQPGVARDRLGTGIGAAFRVGTKLLVADSANNRVLIWNSIPTASGQPADVVLGQPDFAASAAGGAGGAADLFGPSGIWSDGTRLVIADTFNNRVLIWLTFPTTNRAPADVVLGWPAFNQSGPAAVPPTAASLRNPRAVTFDGTRLYVADEGNNRILVWNGMPTTRGEPAALVLGQSTFDGSNKNGGAALPNAIGFYGPTGLAVDSCGALYVCDAGNNRVVVHGAPPSRSGEAADAVLGKPDFVTPASALDPVTAATMDSCYGLTATATSLFVADGGHHRVLRFNLSR